MKRTTWVRLGVFGLFLSILVYQFVPRPPDLIFFGATLPEGATAAVDHYNEITGSQASFTDLLVNSGSYSPESSHHISYERWLARIPNYVDVQFRVNTSDNVGREPQIYTFAATSSGGYKYHTFVPIELRIPSEGSLGTQQYSLDLDSVFEDGGMIFGQANRSMFFAAVVNGVNVAMIFFAFMAALFLLVYAFRFLRFMWRYRKPPENAAQA